MQIPRLDIPWRTNTLEHLFPHRSAARDFFFFDYLRLWYSLLLVSLRLFCLLGLPGLTSSRIGYKGNQWTQSPAT
jgi:hypothetical protein